eukprot:5647033-Amphidinium_carterae.1
MIILQEPDQEREQSFSTRSFRMRKAYSKSEVLDSRTATSGDNGVVESHARQRPLSSQTRACVFENVAELPRQSHPPHRN